MSALPRRSTSWSSSTASDSTAAVPSTQVTFWNLVSSSGSSTPSGRNSARFSTIYSHAVRSPAYQASSQARKSWRFTSPLPQIPRLPSRVTQTIPASHSQSNTPTRYVPRGSAVFPRRTRTRAKPTPTATPTTTAAKSSRSISGEAYWFQI